MSTNLFNSTIYSNIFEESISVTLSKKYIIFLIF